MTASWDLISLRLGHLRLLGVDQLRRRIAFRQQRHVAIQVRLGIDHLSVIAIEIGARRKCSMRPH